MLWEKSNIVFLRFCYDKDRRKRECPSVPRGLRHIKRSARYPGDQVGMRLQGGLAAGGINHSGGTNTTYYYLASTKLFANSPSMASDAFSASVREAKGPA